MRILNSLTINANRNDVLETLRKNREQHGKIIAEARVGYVAKARAAFESRLQRLEKGDLTDMLFHLSPPQDYTGVYDVAITMLEMHTDEHITLDAEQVRYLVRDDWDWMQSFLTSNSEYSATAAAVAATKNYGK